MRGCARVIGCLACLAGVAVSFGAEMRQSSAEGDDELLFKAAPIVLTLGQFDSSYDEATVSDVALADFDDDGRLDIAVAWYATDTDDYLRNVRMLTIYFNEGASFTRGADLNLYVPDPFEAMSVFYIGSGDIGVGDYDGDGDTDLTVTPYFGDEVWVVENLGGRSFAPQLKYPFGWNTAGNPITPPEVLAADFDRDGRDESVYVADPTAQIAGKMIHFWRTSAGIANLRIMEWFGGSGGVATWFVRGLAVADFNENGKPDLCYTGGMNHDVETAPILTFWCDLNPTTKRFTVYNFYPTMLCSDVVAVRPVPTAPPGIILTSLDGTRMQYWTRVGTTGVDFALAQEVTGYAGAADRGRYAAVADVDGDGDLDLVTKLRDPNPADAQQIDFTLYNHVHGTWSHVASRVNTTGFNGALPDEFLRLRSNNLAIGDLQGNTLPEIVAGFAAREVEPSKGGGGNDKVVEIGVWQNSCIGDVTRDGATDYDDVLALEASYGLCDEYLPRALHDALFSAPLEEEFNPDADLDKDGCITWYDEYLLALDLGCTCWTKPREKGDCNCDGNIGMNDINGFVRALDGEHAYYTTYPDCNWLNADINDDGSVTLGDINPFVHLVLGPD